MTPEEHCRTRRARLGRALAFALALGCIVAAAADVNAGPRFLTPIEVPVDGGPVRVVLTQFDDQTPMDIATANETGELGQSASLVLGTGAASYAEEVRTTFPENFTLRAMAAGDFTGDLFSDVAVAGVTGLTESRVLLYSSLGTGELADLGDLPLSGRSPLYVTVADVTADGAADLLVCDSSAAGPGQIEIFAGDNQGDFTALPPLPASSSPARVEAADLDADGFVDLIIWDDALRVLLIAYGSGPATFQPPAVIVGINDVTAFEILPGMSNARRDLAVATSDGTQILWAHQAQARRFDPGRSAPSDNPANVLRAADFDGDSIPDVVLLDQEGGTVKLFTGSPDRTFAEAESLELGTFPYDLTDLAAGEATGDTHIDVAVSSSALDKVLVLPNSGEPPPTRTPTRPATPTPTMGSPTATRTSTPTLTATRPPTPTRAATPGGPGDANCDGSLDIYDMDAVVLELFSADCSAADANVDGRITSADVTAVVEFLSID